MRIKFVVRNAICQNNKKIASKNSFSLFRLFVFVNCSYEIDFYFILDGITRKLFHSAHLWPTDVHSV